MPEFQFHAKNLNGHRIQGVIEAADIGELQTLLAKQDLQLKKARIVTAPTGPSRPRKTHGYFFSLKELAVFCGQLEQYFTIGLPAPIALETIRDSHESSGVRTVLSALIDRINRGESFAEALQHYPHVFGPVFLTLVQAGEHSGKLASLMHYAAKHYRWLADCRFRMRQKIKPPLISLGIVFLIFAVTLPGYFSKISALLLPAIIWAALRLLPKIKHFTDRIVLQIPKASAVIRGYDMAQFSYLFAQLFRAGIPIPEALVAATAVMKNSALREEMAEVAQDVAAGHTLVDALKHQGSIPPLVIKSFMIGQDTGNFDAALDNLYQFYTHDVIDALFYLAEFLRTLAILIGGALVLSIGYLTLPVSQLR